MNNWDEIINVESERYDVGFNDGKQFAVERRHCEGENEGFLKGFALGFESRYLKTISDRLRSQQTDGKGEKLINELHDRSQSIPLTNNRDFDFADEIVRIRHLYKQLGSEYGPCPPTLEQEKKTSLEW
jgi:hypothetical protein